MPEGRIYVKTAKGREEIATRRYRLSQDERLGLILINGKRSMEALVQQLKQAGLSDSIFANLAAQGFIALSDEAPSSDLNTRSAIVYDEAEGELPLRWLDLHASTNPAEQTAQLRWFLVDAVAHLVPEQAMEFARRVEQCTTYDALLRCAVDCERLLLKNLAPAAASPTIAKLRALIK